MNPASVRVWDPLVRVVHWMLVAGIAVTWISAEGGGLWHEWSGYAVLGVVGIRVAWGFAGPHHARFRSFVRGPAATLDYGARVLAHSEPRHLGHNPLGGWMVVALLAAITAAGVTGWLYTTDRFWGIEWVEDLHEACAEAVLWLAALHVTGVVFTSFRHGENLVASMVHGRKRAPAAEDVD